MKPGTVAALVSGLILTPLSARADNTAELCQIDKQTSAIALSAKQSGQSESSVINYFIDAATKSNLNQQLITSGVKFIQVAFAIDTKMTPEQFGQYQYNYCLAHSSEMANGAAR